MFRFTLKSHHKFHTGSLQTSGSTKLFFEIPPGIIDWTEDLMGV